MRVFCSAGISFIVPRASHTVRYCRRVWAVLLSLSNILTSSPKIAWDGTNIRFRQFGSMTAPVTYFVSASGESGFPKHRNGGAVSGSMQIIFSDNSIAH